MSPTSLPPVDAHKDVNALIQTLLETERRLEELTAGEIDTVANSDGAAFFLLRAQERLRLSEATKQAAILDALPANIALIDNLGVIVSVNESWRRFARTNVIHDSGCCIGVDYLNVCDRAVGAHSSEAQLVAEGIRAVLCREKREFSIEYPCHSPIEQRWFLMTVTPLTENALNGAVVMHLNITERKKSEEALRTSEAEFRSLSEAIPQIVWITRSDGWNAYTNKHWTDYTGLSVAESLGHGWIKPFHPDDQARAQVAWEHAQATLSTYTVECRLRRADGEYRWWLNRGVPQKDAAGNVLKWFGTCTDIHDLKMAELEISNANRELRDTAIIMATAQRIAHIGSWERVTIDPSNPDANTLHWSDEMFRIAGYEPGSVEVNNAFFFGLVPLEEHELIRQAVATAIRDRRQYSVIHRLIRPNGEERTLQETAEIIFDEKSGQLLKIVGTAHDITDRKRAEAVLLRQQTELRVLFDVMPAMIWFKDTENRILRVNQRVSEQVGKPINEIEGKPSLEVYPREAAKFYEDDLDVIRSGLPKLGFVEALRSPQGKELWVQTDKVPYFDKDGKVTGIVVMAQDITQRKQAEEALRESEERFSEAFEYAPIGVALVSLEGRWLKVNQALCNFLGYSSAELLARTFQDITAPDDLERDLSSMRRILAGEIRSYQIQKRYVHANGKIVPVLLNVSLVRDKEGRPRHFISQIQDITERLAAEEALRKTESQLRQSQKMEAVGQLAGGVAHDFNNLLTVIIGRAELLEDRGDLPEKALRSIKLIHETGSRAAVLTRQLLQFSRQQILQPQVIDLNTLIPGMQALLRRLISEDIDLTLKLYPKLGKIKADPGQIEQVVMNLVINARDAMPKGGKISIETKRVEFDEKYCATHPDATPGPHVMIAVADSGCGMDEKVRARIFEPFFTTKEIGKGTGLGLSTVYGIVKQSGGNIYVHSEVNHGTVFKVYFPEVTERARAEISTAQLPVPGGAETILLVEDEANIRALLDEILTEKGYTVLIAADGENAIARSMEHKEKIHLLLTDVVMPKMNGKEVASQLLQARPEMKVLFMSGYTSHAIVSRGVLDEGIEFLEKPFTSSSVARRVRQVLDSPIAH